VKYYSDPERHPKRKYIGVVFERDQKLPIPRNAVRRRRLGMVTAKMSTLATNQEVETTTEEVLDDVSLREPSKSARKEVSSKEPDLELRPGYMYRMSNWQIGRAAERANIKVREYKPRDRFTAWRKANARKAKNAERASLRSRKK